VIRIVNLDPRMWVFESLIEIGASLSIVKMIKLACVIVEKRKKHYLTSPVVENFLCSSRPMSLSPAFKNIICFLVVRRVDTNHMILTSPTTKISSSPTSGALRKTTTQFRSL
jgi:hypothetical protein